MNPSLLLRATLCLFTLSALAEEPIALGSRRELFVDRLLIDRLEGAELRLQTPQPGGVAVRFDQPFEGKFSGYITVLHDEAAEKYLMYYRGDASTQADDICTCYAESTDGVHWTKPALGLNEMQGTKANNVVLAHASPYTHNFAPFIDDRAGVPPEERFKSLAGLGGKEKGLCAFASGDGLHWHKMLEEEVLTKGAFDSQNVSFWSEAEHAYVAYFRVFTSAGAADRPPAVKGIRWVSRATSKDFLHWSTPVQMTCDQPLVDHIYISQTHPYFRAPHLYISTAARFMAGKAVATAEQKAQMAEQVKAWPSLLQDCSEAVLMTSRAGEARFNRTFMEGFVRPGGGIQNWTSRTNYPACGVVQTGERELSLYVERHYAQADAYVERLTLRLDGFASLHAGYAGGEMVTKPLTFTGRELRLNFATGASGSVAVEVQDADGQAMPGLALADFPPITGDEIDRPATWKAGKDVSALAGKTVRLRFVLKDADVFAMRFQ